MASLWYFHLKNSHLSYNLHTYHHQDNCSKVHLFGTVDNKRTKVATFLPAINLNPADQGLSSSFLQRWNPWSLIHFMNINPSYNLQTYNHQDKYCKIHPFVTVDNIRIKLAMFLPTINLVSLGRNPWFLILMVLFGIFISFIYIYLYHSALGSGTAQYCKSNKLKGGQQTYKHLSVLQFTDVPSSR